MPPLKLTTGLLSLALATACGGRPPCGSCPDGSVCDLDGTCRVLATRPELRFARVVRLRPQDWAGARADIRREAGYAFDEWLLGGEVDGRLYLAFDVPAGEIVTAVLRLTPIPRSPSLGAMTLQIFRTRSFVGARVSHRRRPRRIRRVGSMRRVEGAEGRPIYLDVTELVRGREGSRVFLGVAANDGDTTPWRIASPLANDVDAQPHLDVRIR